MFEETKEMIDSTVYPNGNGEITAQNINLALHGVVDATADKIEEVETEINQLGEKVAEIGENGTGGSGALRVWKYYDDISELTQEQIAENIATYNVLVSGENADVIWCDKGEDGVVTYTITCPTQSFTLGDAEGTSVGFYVDEVDVIMGTTTRILVELRPDGSHNWIHYGEEPATPSTPASNGPLRVWINEENTPEQIAENIATRNSLLANPYQSVLICSEFDYTEYGSGIIKQAGTVDSVMVTDGEVAIGIIKPNLDGDQNIISQKLESLLIQEDGTILSD